MKKALLFGMTALASTAFATIVPYGEAPEQTGDLLLPDGGVRPWTPKLLLLHGGGWRSPDYARATLADEAELFRAAGYAVYNVDYRLRGIVPPMALKLKWLFYEKTVINLLKKRLGLERANFFPTAGSFIPPAVEEFVHSVGINMTAGYGMTETTATVSCDWHHSPVSIGSVGRVLEGIEISFGEQNEILLRGDTIMKEYYRKPDVTAQAYDKDGWFHTGDCGYIKNGELYLTDRIKDLFKTSNGKYISPQVLESKFVVDRYIDEVAIIADEHKFVSALIIPDYKLLEQWATEKGIAFENREQLCANPLAVQMVLQRIETLQQEFAHYEQVKRITLLPQPFSMERGELTNTLKIKRHVIAKNYKAQIDAMYEE